ncbi:hypothetical protein BMS3Abin07_02336 [bacterium BMS3Abin07]|nr:hypothetical protein BMS3Abin07_02336 [bacterium BMS3Abin07]GBE31301.1 hypothetical protein BMS3Bbin05_00201 [bacterium BMS3Bbin05]HDO22154.1 DUF507 family protein [Nitrospirota bacterium]HDZ88298.1 DUF507 family protein [Nitrospirota bacterium]
MRIPKSWVSIIAMRITKTLIEKGLIEPKVKTSQLIDISQEILLEELMVEDRLNDEVREILKTYEREIDSKRLDYRKVFDMTKYKLVRERNIIL